jgi:hypothetical protein
MARVSRKHCKSIGKSYRRKASNGRKASCVKKSSRKTKRRSPRKAGSKRRSPRKAGSKKSSRKNCPKGQVKSYKRLASGKLSKRGVCVPKTVKASTPVEEEAGDYEFNLPALGYRIRRRSGRKSRRHSKRRSHRKY